MLDLLIDFGDLSRTAIAKLLRTLWWLGWDFCVRTIGWSIGWVFFRIVTLGRFPSEGFRQVDEAPWFVGLLVEAFGLALLALSVYAVTQSWPKL